MEKERAISLIRNKIERIVKLQSLHYHSPERSKWERDTKVTLRKIFGEDSSKVKDFTKIDYTFATFENYSSAVKVYYQEQLKKAEAILLSMVDEINEFWESEESTESPMQHQNADEIVRKVLNNFGNSVKKITQSRRKEHDLFVINDEYDVQDLQYLILKSYFKNLKDEDPIEKIGGSSSRIDLIIPEENVLIEIKMIKKTDENEKKFIKQLKEDFESYHACKWLNKCILFCYIYDPENKTSDINNFHELNGPREKQGHKFEVEVIVGN